MAKNKLAKPYAVKVFIKPSGFKGRTYKGLVFAESPTLVNEAVFKMFCNEDFNAFFTLKKEDVKIRQCELYGEFGITPND